MGPRGQADGEPERAAPLGEGAFRLVEFAARRRAGFRNLIVPVEAVPELVGRFGAFGCYSSFHLFDEGLAGYADAHPRGGHPSVAGYEGQSLAPVWPLDVDAPDLNDALTAARTIYRHLTAEWEIPAEAVQAYFSGKKGFHLLIDTQVFGLARPSLAATELLRRLTNLLCGELGAAADPIDLTLEGRMRLLRLPNTRHEASGLYKVPLSRPEFLAVDPGEVLRTAGTPRPLDGWDATGLLSRRRLGTTPRARRLLTRAAAQGRRSDPARFPAAEPGGGAAVLACPARRRLYEEPALPGRRNSVAVRLASWLREGNHDAERAAEYLALWNRRNPQPLSEGELTHVITSAFAGRRAYHYGCRDPFIAPLCPRGEREACPYHRGGKRGVG